MHSNVTCFLVFLLGVFFHFATIELILPLHVNVPFESVTFGRITVFVLVAHVRICYLLRAQLNFFFLKQIPKSAVDNLRKESSGKMAVLYGFEGGALLKLYNLRFVGSM